MKQESKYEQIVHYLKNEIESGRFSTGSRLPSIRKLSQDMINTSTPNLKVVIMFWSNKLVMKT